MRKRVRSLASLSGLRIRRCRELWCRLQTRLGSHVAVAVVQASGCSSDSTPGLGTSRCRRCSPKMTNPLFHPSLSYRHPLTPTSSLEVAGGCFPLRRVPTVPRGLFRGAFPRSPSVPPGSCPAPPQTAPSSAHVTPACPELPFWRLFCSNPPPWTDPAWPRESVSRALNTQVPVLR